MEDNNQEKFYKTLSWYFGEKENLKGAIIRLSERLESLSEDLKKGEESSAKLTKALNSLTLFGALIALGTLLFEIFKYING